MEHSSQQRATRRLVSRLVLVAVGMFGFGFALVPLYDVFCQLTGINGKTGSIEETAAEARGVDQTRRVTVNFIANVNGLAWDFAPAVRQVQVYPGELKEVLFYAENRSGRNMVGHAVPSVSPGAASKYFNKTECFCFSEQLLRAGERKEMPVRFVIDPDVPKHVHSVALAYTFFESRGGDSASDRVARAASEARTTAQIN